MNINTETKLYLLLGNPVSHSLSPALHNAGFQALNLNCLYLACSVDPLQVGSALQGIRALSVAGANVTSPFKETVIPLLDSIDDEAAAIRSVNTIINRNGLLQGYTTDGQGFLKALKQAVPDYDLNQPLLLIGAGGAAGAIALTMAQEGVPEIYIANRSLDRAARLKEALCAASKLNKCFAMDLSFKSLQQALDRCPLAIYTLPVDSKEVIAALNDKDDGEFEHKLLFDLRYSPPETTVMSAFRVLGGAAFNGLGMLFWQAVTAFELFTGKQAPVQDMFEAINQNSKGE